MKIITCFAAAFAWCAISVRAQAACPALAGDYECVTSMSSKSEPWSLRQSVDSNGYTVYEFDNKRYVTDGVERIDASVSYRLLHTTVCTASEMIVSGKGEYDDGGKVFRFTNRLVQYKNSKEQLISEYWHDGSLIDRMVCTAY